MLNVGEEAMSGAAQAAEHKRRMWTLALILWLTTFKIN